MISLLLTVLAGAAPLFGQDFQTANGRPFSLDEILEQGPAVLVFWNSWIPGGEEFVPVLREVDQVARSRKLPGAVVVFQDEGEGWVRTIGAADAGLPRIADRRGVLLRRFQVTRAPSMVVVDRDGKVIGRSGPDAADVRSLLQQLVERRDTTH